MEKIRYYVYSLILLLGILTLDIQGMEGENLQKQVIQSNNNKDKLWLQFHSYNMSPHSDSKEKTQSQVHTDMIIENHMANYDNTKLPKISGLYSQFRDPKILEIYKQAIEQERKYPNSFPFYYSRGKKQQFISDLILEIRRYIDQEPYPKTIVFFRKNPSKFASMKEFWNDIHQEYPSGFFHDNQSDDIKHLPEKWNDHRPPFGPNTISASLTFFGNNGKMEGNASGEGALGFFSSNSNVAEQEGIIDFTKILRSTLKEFNVPRDKWKKYFNLYNKYIHKMQNNYLYQIFIHSSIVENLVTLCGPFAEPLNLKVKNQGDILNTLQTNTLDILSKYKTAPDSFEFTLTSDFYLSSNLKSSSIGVQDIQARILLNKNLTDFAKTEIYMYSLDEEEVGYEKELAQLVEEDFKKDFTSPNITLATQKQKEVMHTPSENFEHLEYDPITNIMQQKQGKETVGVAKRLQEYDPTFGYLSRINLEGKFYVARSPLRNDDQKESIEKWDAFFKEGAIFDQKFSEFKAKFGDTIHFARPVGKLPLASGKKSLLLFEVPSTSRPLKDFIDTAYNIISNNSKDNDVKIRKIISDIGKIIGTFNNYESVIINGNYDVDLIGTIQGTLSYIPHIFYDPYSSPKKITFISYKDFNLKGSIVSDVWGFFRAVSSMLYKKVKLISDPEEGYNTAHEILTILLNSYVNSFGRDDDKKNIVLYHAYSVILLYLGNLDNPHVNEYYRLKGIAREKMDALRSQLEQNEKNEPNEIKRNEPDKKDAKE